MLPAVVSEHRQDFLDELLGYETFVELLARLPRSFEELGAQLLAHRHELVALLAEHAVATDELVVLAPREVVDPDRHRRRFAAYDLALRRGERIERLRADHETADQ